MCYEKKGILEEGRVLQEIVGTLGSRSTYGGALTMYIYPPFR